MDIAAATAATVMTLHSALLWGAFGSFIVEGLEFRNEVRRRAGQCPPEWKTAATALAVCVRIGSGAGLAVALYQSGQISGPLGALTVGVTMPMIVSRMSEAAAGLEKTGSTTEGLADD